MLRRVGSPGFQHTAVMSGCVEPSEAASVANKYRNILLYYITLNTVLLPINSIILVVNN